MSTLGAFLCQPRVSATQMIRQLVDRIQFAYLALWIQLRTAREEF
jgi:hypothetical protein